MERPMLALLVAACCGVIRGQAAERACVTVGPGPGCRDISGSCAAQDCRSGEVCAVTPAGAVTCLPGSVRDGQNCGSERRRLSQPCATDADVIGFAAGCTLCRSADVLRSRIPAPPVVRPPAIPRTRPEDLPRPPAPPPITDKACVVRHVGNGRFKKQCMEISRLCKQKKCPPGTVCGLNLEEAVECFPESVREFQNCAPDFFRLSQPCPADAGIRGFGMGCNFCVGGNPFRQGPEPPQIPLRSTDSVVTGAGEPPAPPPLPPAIPGPAPETNACVVVHVGAGEFKEQCVDISDRCAAQECPAGTVCGLDLDERVQCFPKSVKEFENCGSDLLRLSQPCPADAGIRGFGMGCTFCVGGNPFEFRSLQRRQTSEENRTAASQGDESACVVRFVGGGSKKECRSISAQCEQRKCPENTICGLDLDEQIQCFPASVKDFENCAEEASRLSQPCPADAGIRGFGMGCTFCEGGGSFLGPSLPSGEPPSPEPVGPPIPAPAPAPAPVAAAGSDQSITGRLACVSRVTSSGAVRRGCLDLTELCRRRACPDDRTCALDATEQPSCFAASQLPLRNCGTTRERVARPCPQGAEVVAFGAGCTFCRRPPTPPPPPPPAAADGPQRACIVSGALRRCEDITERCADLRCGDVCALATDGAARCFAAAELPAANCASERRRLDQPCPAGQRAVAFGAGCTYCEPQ